MEQSFTISGKSGVESYKVAGDEKDVELFMLEFMSLFPGMIDIEQQVLRPGVVTAELRSIVEAFVAKYGGRYPQLNRISALLRKFKDDETFFIYPFVDMAQVDSFMIHSIIDSLNSGKDHNEEFKKILNLFGDVLTDYKLGTYGHVRFNVGGKDRSKRMCRFCYNTKTPLTFNKRAHAISEALGNKTVTLNDECDVCNEEFSKDVEQDIVEYYSFFRALHGIRGKGGIKEYKGKNFKIFRESGELHINYYESEDKPKELMLSNNLVLAANREISRQNIYRCLSKYFLSVIDAKHLHSFAKTIDWVNGKFDAERLPKVTKFNHHGWFMEQPTMTTYIRTSADRSLPFAVGEFQFGFMKTAFIVPFSSEDDLTYTNKEEFNLFWKKFKHYNLAPDSRLEDLSDARKRPFQIKLNINIPSTDETSNQDSK